MKQNKLPSVEFVEKLLEDPVEANMYFAKSNYVPVDVTGRINFAFPIPHKSGKGVKMHPTNQLFILETLMPEEVAQSDDLIQYYLQAAIRDQHEEFVSVSNVATRKD